MKSTSKQVLHLISEIPPSVNHAYKTRVVPKWIKGKKVHMPIVYMTKEGKDYKKRFAQYVKDEVKKQKWDIEETKERHHYMDCVFYFPRIDMDEQNYYKCMCDAMNEIAYYDDRNILTRANAVYYDNKNPRIEMKIHAVNYIGIFSDEGMMKSFESQLCKNCKRYKRNCSILKKAKEGRIQEELDEKTLECKKFNPTKDYKPIEQN